MPAFFFMRPANSGLFYWAKRMTVDIETIGVGFDTSGLVKGQAALKETAQAANKAADAADHMSSSAADANKTMMTWHQFVKANMGPAMRQFAAEGVSHAEAHTRAIRQIAEEWKKYKETGESAHKGVAAASLSAAAGVKQYGDAAAMAERQTKTLASTTENFNKLISGAAIALGFRAYIQMADAATNLDSRLKLVTTNSQQLAAVHSELFQIAQGARVNFNELGNTYAQIARASNELGISQTRLLGVTKTISQAITISGVSAQSANAALVQLTQGLASGTLRGEELNSVMEQTPRLAQAIAQGLGVSIGQLRAMGQEGKLTSEAVIGALESSAKSVDAEFGRVTPTVSGSLTQIGNSLGVVVGEFDKATGASSSLAGGLQSVSSALDSVGKTISQHQTLFGVIGATLAGAAVLAALPAVASGLSLVATGVTAIGVALAANPLVLTLLGIGAVVGGGVALYKGYQKTAEGLQATNEALIQQRAAIEGNIAKAEKYGETWDNKLSVQKARLAAVNQQIADNNQKLALMSAGNVDTTAEDARLARHAQAMQQSQKDAAMLADTRRQLAGVDKDYLPTLTKLQEAYQRGSMSEKEYISTVSELAKQTYKKSEAGKDAAKDAAKAYSASIAALEQQSKMEKEVLSGSLSTIESQHKQALISDEQYALAKRDIKLKELASEEAVIKKQIENASAKKELADRAKFVGELSVLEQRRKNIIQTTNNEIGDIHAASFKEMTAELTKWENATKAEQGLLEEEAALFSKSAEARKIAAAQMKVDADVRQFLAEEQKKNHKLLPDEIALLLMQAQARKNNISSIMGEGQAYAGATQLILENQRFAAEAIADEQKRSEAILQIDATIWRERIALAGDGTDAQKKLQEQFDQWYANRQMQPVLDRWKNVISNLDNDFREGFRDMLSHGKGAWEAFSKSIGNTLKTALADALYQTFLKKYVVQIVAGMAGMISGPAVANALTGGNSVMQGANLVNAGSSLYSAATGMSSFGNTAAQLYQYGSTLAGGGTAAVSTGAAGTGWVSAEGGNAILSSGASSFGSTIATAMPYLAAAAVIYSIAKSLDNSGTYHTGALAQYSAAGGLQTGSNGSHAGPTAGSSAYGTGFGGVDFSQQTADFVSGISQSIVGILDSTATSFGKSAGYSAATAFADDTSKDGAWGGLLISKLGETIVNWQDTRNSKWAPREFGDGEAGKTQYLAEISKSVRSALDGIGLPGWAQHMLDALGDAPALTDLSAVVDKINAAQKALVSMGNAIAGFASLSDSAVTALITASGGVDAFSANMSAFYDGYYSDAEKMANVSKQVSDALSAVGLAMPATRDEYRAMVEQELALGESGAVAVAALLKASGAFGTVADYSKQMADQAIADAQRQSEETAQAAQAQADAVRSAHQAALDAAMKGVDTAFSAVQRAVEAERNGITDTYNAQVDSFNTRIQDVTGSVSKLASLSDSLRSTVDRMRLSSERVSDRNFASAQIDSALLLARTGGVLPDAESLRNALDVIAQPSEDLFATFTDYQRDFIAQRGKIEELARLTDAQKSIEERTLDSLQEQLKATQEGYKDEMSRLDSQLSYAQQQVDILNGIDTHTLSVATAIANLQIKLGTAQAAQAVVAGDSGTLPNSISGLYENILGRAPDAAGAAFWQSAMASNPNYQGGTSSIITDFINGALSGGTAQDKINAIEWAKEHKLPGFDGGTNYVPYDMPAMIHQGEEITPRPFVDMQRRDRDKTNSLLEQLVVENQKLRAELEEAKDSIKQMADQFENVTEGGNAMRTEVMGSEVTA